MRAFVEYGELRDAAGRFQRMPENVAESVSTGVRRATEIVYRQAQDNISRMFKTSGKFESALKMGFDTIGGIARGEVSISGVEYVIHELGGKRSYEIFPRNRKALKFQAHQFLGSIGLEDAFAAHVTHPPLPKRSYLALAVEEKQAEIRELFGEAIRTGFRKS